MLSSTKQLLSPKIHLIFWTSIALLDYIEMMFLNTLNGNAGRAAFSSLLYIIGWLLWIFSAPFVIRFSAKFPIRSVGLRRNIWRHVGFGLFVVIGLLGIEITLMLLISYYFFDIDATRNTLPNFIAYTFHVRLLTYLFIVSVTQGLMYFERVQDFRLKNISLQSKLTEAQLKTLKMQIQPHFLFNTHQAISGLMLKKENDKAIEMLSGLSSLLRHTLKVQDQKFITLKQELDIVSQYLTIQQVRFHDRLKIFIDDPGELTDALVPPFILQPLIENAIQHGFAPYADAGLIEVKVMKEGGRIKINVRDDGAGLRPSFGRKGIGIQNTRARLNEIYHSDFYFELSNHPEKGAVAVIDIPLKMSVDTEDELVEERNFKS